jgi:ribose 5-phosphate isomerase B
MKIFFAADHAGFKLKERLKKYAAALGYEPIDAGAFSIDPADDYPDFIVPAVRAAVATGERAVVFGGSGLGECIAANKVKGARAASCFDVYTAKMSRLDNDANVLCLGGRTTVAKKGVAEKILKIWLATKFSNAARHKRRLAKIALLEKTK